MEERDSEARQALARQGARQPVAIVGARGYAGLELARILLNHPRAELKACFATDAKWALADYLSGLPEQAARVPVMEMAQLEELLPEVRVVFLATPAEVSMRLAPMILQAGASVIDLSGAFRLGAEQYPEWYGFEHACPGLLEQAEYGLVPWCGPVARDEGDACRGPRLVANPGCYATSVLMAVLPLLKAKVIQPDTLVVDAKSGTSGAGRKAEEGLSFTEVDGECLPYKVGNRHQHLPELQRFLVSAIGLGPLKEPEVDLFFTTHLLPVRRGIISSIYARLAPDFAKLSDAELYQAMCEVFEAAYQGYPLLSVGIAARPSLLLRKIVGTARTQVSFSRQSDKLFVFSLIDNLLKGAAGQAVENFNRLEDLPVETALNRLGGMI